MSEVTSSEPGTPSWAELGTTDAEGAKAFYGAVFGWEMADEADSPAGTYTICKLDGKSVVGLYEQSPAMRDRGVPALWLVFVSVASADDATTTVEEAGGKVHAQPFDVGEAGRMALVQDPTGAMFALWEERDRPGAERMHEPGTLDWFELATSDPDAARGFYEKALGWAVQSEEYDGTSYITCKLNDEPVAGLLPADALPEGVPPNWGVYFAVEDCAATVEKAKEAGGEVLFGPQETPSVGSFAGLRDPQGAAFAVIQPAPPEAESEDESAEGESAEDESAEDGSAEDESAEGESAEDGSAKGKSSEGKSSEGKSSGSGEGGDSEEKSPSAQAKDEIEQDDSDGDQKADGDQKE